MTSRVEWGRRMPITSRMSYPFKGESSVDTPEDCEYLALLRFREGPDFGPSSISHELLTWSERKQRTGL